jgi:DNA-binding NarL/FixJ family response regulator
MQSAFSLPVVAYSAVSELEAQLHLSPKVVILSLIEASHEASIGALRVLSELARGVPVIVLASVNDAELARTVVRHGAKGYIPVAMGFDIAIEAVRFVLAGGTYVPMDCLLAGPPGGESSSQSSNTMTGRELAVIRAIQQGEPNKLIAYHLNMCESTVKVHVRNVMKKLEAKNRTEVAIKAQTGLLVPLASQA